MTNSKPCFDAEGVREPDSLVTKHSWFALQVRARHEISVSDYLAKLGYEQFLPLYKCRRRWSDRIKEVETPLFPGYCFCRFDPLDRLPILKAPGVIQVVGYSRVPIPVEEDEIRGIQALISAGIPSQPWPFLGVGDKVRIESGPLAGLEGILTDFKGSHRLVLSITLLQRAVAVEIDSAFVTYLQPSRAGREREAFSQGQAVPVAV